MHATQNAVNYCTFQPFVFIKITLLIARMHDKVHNYMCEISNYI